MAEIIYFALLDEIILATKDWKEIVSQHRKFPSQQKKNTHRKPKPSRIKNKSPIYRITRASPSHLFLLYLTLSLWRAGARSLCPRNQGSSSAASARSLLRSAEGPAHTAPAPRIDQSLSLPLLFVKGKHLSLPLLQPPLLQPPRGPRLMQMCLCVTAFACVQEREREREV